MLILDTHAILWDALDPPRLSRRARRAIDAASAERALGWAAISLWEIALLADRGRILVPGDLAAAMEDMLAARHARVLPLTARIAVRAQQLAQLDDPADRLIAATALVHEATLVSADTKIAQLAGLKLLW
jgi:PIN domain nuclease of toxin-antitoxin system